MSIVSTTIHNGELDILDIIGETGLEISQSI